VLVLRARDRYCGTLALLAVLALQTVALAETAVLRVGTSGDYAPFSLRAPAGELTGFDVAVAQRFAHDVGREVVFVPFRWPDLVASARAGAFDVVMSGVTVRADRALFLTFSRPYAVTGAVAVVRTADRDRFRAVADLDREGVRIAVNRGGHLEQVARQYFAHARVIPFAENTALQGALARGDVEAAVSEEFEARTWTAAPFVPLGPFTHDLKAYAVRRDSGELLRQVDDWLAARERDGWLNEQRRRWLGDDAVRTPEEAGFEALVAALDLRLQLMPLVAAVKRRNHLPIEDPAQEARVLERTRGAAAAAGLQPDAVVALFRIQMRAAKAIEHASPDATAPAGLTLGDVRAAVATVSDQLIRELARCQPWLAEPRSHEQLGATLRAGLRLPGAQAFVPPLLDALHEVRRGS
jgi:cyclohexadienyl dehydratase